MVVKFAYETTPLHGFLVNYFTQLGANVVDLQETYFEVVTKDGAKRRFTYSSAVAAENENIELLAPGSRALKRIFDEAATRGSAAVLLFKQSQDQVEDFVAQKWQNTSRCCDKCPQYGECNYDKCCPICPARHDCHHLIVGSRLHKVLINDQKLKPFFQFTFLVEILNPVRKQDELFHVLVDPEDGKTFEPLTPEIIETNLYHDKGQLPLSLQLYDLALTHAYAWVDSKIQGNLAFLRQQTMRSVSEKAAALQHRLKMESEEGKSPEGAHQRFEQGLKQLQKQYQINVEVTLLSVLVIYIPEYQLEIELENGSIIPVLLNPATNRVAHPICHECGKEVLEGWSCVNGHYVCKECADRCVSCGAIFCVSCSESQARCAICGDLVCADCKTSCSKCGKVVCKDHLYPCHHCGEYLCLSCINICQSCEKDLCVTHTKKCSCCDSLICDDCSIGCNEANCNKILLRDHAKECSYCHQPFCGDHVAKTVNGHLACAEHRATCIKCNKEYRIDELKRCAICGSHMCQNDQETCYKCEKIICPRDVITCTTCQTKGCPDHTKKCVTCDKVFCLSHIIQCSRCSQWVCQDHVIRCSGCGEMFCSCTKTSTCRNCGQQYCHSCLEDGMCPACRDMVNVEPSDGAVRHVKGHDSKVAGWKKWKVGHNADTLVVIGYGLLGGMLFVISKDGKLLARKDISLFERIKRSFK